MYADFEVILEPTQESSNLDSNQPYTKEVNQHTHLLGASSTSYGEVQNPLKLCRGKDCVHKFCDYIRQEAHRLCHMFPEKLMDPLTKEQWARYKEATKCHICYKPFDSKNFKVRDHCHYTGPYRGPAHRNCNLRYRIPSYIPVVFHNLSGYDAHLFIKELGAKSKDIGVIDKNIYCLFS